MKLKNYILVGYLVSTLLTILVVFWAVQRMLIDKQFDCMAKYLSWDLLFQKSYYATAKDELSKNQDAMKELEDIGKDL